LITERGQSLPAFERAALTFVLMISWSLVLYLTDQEITRK